MTSFAANFDAYVTPTDARLSSALREGLVSLDANVLLNFYRYNDAARKTMGEAFIALGDSLWVSHQATLEFWRNRENALVGPSREIAKLRSELGSVQDQVADILRQWKNRAALDESKADELITALGQTIESAAASLDELVDETEVRKGHDSNHDAVVQQLTSILDGHCGEPMDPADFAAGVKEGNRRADQQEPPGYKDAKKQGGNRREGAAGDYLVWAQSVAKATAQARDLVLVTGDVKEDWWRYVDRRPVGPRPELAEEFRATNPGRTLFMLTPERLLSLVGTTFGVGVADEVIADVGRIEEAARRSIAPSPWTKRDLEIVMNRLDTNAPIQASVIRAAASEGGYIERDRVYEIANFSAERSLRGFTRPVHRVVESLQTSELIDDNLETLLVPDYSPSADYPAGQASGFSIPSSAHRLLAASDDALDFQLNTMEQRRVEDYLYDLVSLLGVTRESHEVLWVAGDVLRFSPPLSDDKHIGEQVDMDLRERFPHYRLEY